MIYMPKWGLRNDKDVRNFVVQSRNDDFREIRTSFHADYGVGREIGMGRNLGKPLYGGKDCKEYIAATSSSPGKLTIGLLVGLGSFSASSPHFMLNVLTVFFCSVAFGLSMSIQAMEMGDDFESLGAISGFRTMEMQTFITALFLIGQLIGCSGGTLFLAEFVVTAVSLLLGGAATISTGAIESWILFLCFSTTAFWGYLFSRVGVTDGMRQKRCSGSSILLLFCLVLASGFWVFVMVLWDWEIPSTAMIIRKGAWVFAEPKREEAALAGGAAARRLSTKHLQ